MAVSTDIVAMYRGPAPVWRRLLSRAQSEPRALAYLMGACVIMFVAQWPAIARRVWETDPARFNTEGGAFQQAVQPEIGGALLGAVIFLPLIFYVLALVLSLLSRVAGKRLAAFDGRLILFWSLLAATPLALLNGLVAGFVGPGIGLTIVGALWFGVVLWFVGTGVREAHREAGVTA